MPLESSDDPKSARVPLTRNQIRGFWAAWGGWTLDGMDSFIYALVLLPSLRELLPRSGIAPTKGNIGFYGGLLFALFLLGWGLAFLWGPVGDKFGRVRTLMLTIVWYSVFTFLSSLVTSVWQLAILRLLAGIGIGGEWAMGGTFVAEEWPESRRWMATGIPREPYRCTPLPTRNVIRFFHVVCAFWGSGDLAGICRWSSSNSLWSGNTWTIVARVTPIWDGV